MLERIADELIEAEERHWRSGAGWRGKPLAQSTRERKRRQRLPSKVLRETGGLEFALVVRGAPGQLLEFNRHEVRFGIKGGRSPVYYGRFHQKGRGVPKRIIVPEPTARTRKALAGVVRVHLTS